MFGVLFGFALMYCVRLLVVFIAWVDAVDLLTVCIGFYCVVLLFLLFNVALGFTDFIALGSDHAWVDLVVFIV